jgi:hypothetical protein
VARGRIVKRGGQEVHAATFLRERRIVLDEELRGNSGELNRIVVHELFHFAWVRLGNEARRSWERVVAAEVRARCKGELGWSAEWRKDEFRGEDVAQRSRRWREYCCESFCDTAAWRYGGLKSHEEFTLSKAARARRAAWFEALPKELRV